MGKADEEFHTYVLDDSEIKAPVRLDELTGRKFVQIPELEENKIYTKLGYLWVSVAQDSCPYHEGISDGSEAYHDCGSCKFLKTAQAGDMIGICLCKKTARETK